MKYLVNALAVTLTCGVLAWAADLVRLAGFVIYVEQYIAVMVALALPLVYLTVPARREPAHPEQEGTRRSGSVPWYDLLAAAAGFALGIFIAFRFPDLSEMGSQRPWDGLIPAIMLCLLFLEGLRRTSAADYSGCCKG